MNNEPNTAGEILSETEIIKKNICDSCYDESLHNLINTPIEEVANAMREHTAQTLNRLKERAKDLSKEYECIKRISDPDGESYKLAKERKFAINQVLNLIEEVSDE